MPPHRGAEGSDGGGWQSCSTHWTEQYPPLHGCVAEGEVFLSRHETSGERKARRPSVLRARVRLRRGWLDHVRHHLVANEAIGGRFE